MQIHRRLPPGDVLVFLTGEREILDAARELELVLNDDRVQAESESEEP